MFHVPLSYNGSNMNKATTDEIARWDELVAQNPDGGNALQTLAWGDFKGRWGWEPRRYVATVGGSKVAVQFLVRRIPLLGEVWYCPKGPGVTTQNDLIELVGQFKATDTGALFLKLEPEILELASTRQKLLEAGLVKGTRDLQSKSTIFIDLTPGEEGVLASFNQSARRNIRKADAGGVQVHPVEATEANLEIMFQLMLATEARAGYGLRPAAYFKDYWKSQIDAGQGQLLFATHEGDILAGLFVTFIGTRAWYKDGGSFVIKRELQSSYGMQWETMRWLIGRGITSYDTVGVPNPNEIGTGNPRQGLYDFKSKFNPDITEFIGCWDVPLDTTKYGLWLKLGERVAGKLANKSPEKYLY
jgi:lipid II:glycine glycyltransferase (peptidoglycan interpeptide bridge formation enzyme)